LASGPRPRYACAIVTRPAQILTFDSGLGGLTVHAEILRACPGATHVYAADDAAFPYGRLSEAALVARVLDVMQVLVELHRPDIIVVACNTASTLVLPHLRKRWPNLPFVGTVPAVKPAAEKSKTHMISVLATPGTVARDYTRDLVRDYAAHCEVTLVGAPHLADLAEAQMRGEPADDLAIAAEVMPCFVEREGRRTDHVVLACTHYPLLLETFRRLAPWPVDWVDPAPAIARRVEHVLRERGITFPHQAAAVPQGLAHFTSGKPATGVLAAVLRRHHLEVRGGVALPSAS
jgi:glutamate racemase